MKILVTGSLGTIGQKLVPELRERKHEVYGCDLAHDADEYGKHFGGEGYYQKCDVGIYRQVAAVIDRVRPQLVYHAAAEFGRWNGEDFYERLWQTNVIGTKHILALQADWHFRLVHFSSSEVYGECSAVMSEDLAPRRLLNDYAMTKWCNEQQIINATEIEQTQSIIVRLFNTYGPGERYSPYRSVNCQFLYRAMKGLPLKVHDGHARTSTYVDDTVRTLANISENFLPGSIYNIAGSQPHTIFELAQIAMQVMGNKVQIEALPKEPLTTMMKIPNIARAEKELGHKCTVTLEDGMARTAEWMRKEYGM